MAIAGAGQCGPLDGWYRHFDGRAKRGSPASMTRSRRSSGQLETQFAAPMFLMRSLKMEPEKFPVQFKKFPCYQGISSAPVEPGWWASRETK
jgi:hypothetical protein